MLHKIYFGKKNCFSLIKNISVKFKSSIFQQILTDFFLPCRVNEIDSPALRKDFSLESTLCNNIKKLNEGINTKEALELTCHPIEAFWCEENRKMWKNNSWLHIELHIKDFLQPLNVFFYPPKDCVHTPPVKLLKKKVFDRRWKVRRWWALRFPSATVKDGNWGHIEHEWSRNIKGPPGSVQWRAVCLQYAATRLLTAAWQPETSAGISARLRVWQIQRACQVETVSEELLSY